LDLVDTSLLAFGVLLLGDFDFSPRLLGLRPLFFWNNGLVEVLSKSKTFLLREEGQ
jgi:hypothetical protein